MGVWCPFFPRSKFIFIYTNLSVFYAVNIWLSALLCSPKYQDTSWSTSSYVHIELSTCFNVKHIAFIICVIGPGKIGPLLQTPFYWWIYYSYSHDLPFHIDKYHIVGFLREKFFTYFMNQLPFMKILPSKSWNRPLRENFGLLSRQRMSIRPSHMRLLIGLPFI